MTPHVDEFAVTWVVKHAVTTTEYSTAAELARKTEARAEVVLVGSDASGGVCVEPGNEKFPTTDIKVSLPVGDFCERGVEFIPQSEIQRQAGINFPVVLKVTRPFRIAEAGKNESEVLLDRACSTEQECSHRFSRTARIIRVVSKCAREIETAVSSIRLILRDLASTPFKASLQEVFAIQFCNVESWVEGILDSDDRQ